MYQAATRSQAFPSPFIRSPGATYCTAVPVCCTQSRAASPPLTTSKSRMSLECPTWQRPRFFPITHVRYGNNVSDWIFGLYAMNILEPSEGSHKRLCGTCRRLTLKPRQGESGLQLLNSAHSTKSSFHISFPPEGRSKQFQSMNQHPPYATYRAPHLPLLTDCNVALNKRGSSSSKQDL
jgi:hypothetical protein